MDRVITDVARAMTNADPPGGLRTAVLSRIEPRPAWRLIWIVSPVALTVLVALMIGLRPSGSKPEMPLPASPVAATSIAAAGPASPLVTQPAPARAASPRPTPRLSVRSIAALAEPTTLSAEDIQPDVLDIPLLRMKPIVTEPIAIKAIDDSGARQ
ncbi:MAG TPA: hypothetical protein VES67_00530 [Vicinamibacterales bacterium]|nr:hypothetical protein [Vicinamibacterales bacterium]